jgi:hypothetical protein
MSDGDNDTGITAPPPPTRASKLFIEPAQVVGFTVWQDGKMLAALTSRAEVANWIEDHLGSLPGEREREARDYEATRRDMPNIIRPEETAPGWAWRRK